MRKLLVIVFAIIILTSCVTTPDTISIQSTVESAVNTAIAPYESRYKEFITAEDLAVSQNEQNKQIQQVISEQIEYRMSDISDNIVRTTVVPTVSPGTVVEYVGGEAVPTPHVYSYDNKNSNCVDRFTYVSDMTVPDGMTITPYTNFPKTWYITNSGDCVWNSNYKIVYQSGSEVGKSKSFPLLKSGNYIQPGESVTVSADLVAPDAAGRTFTTYWAIENDRGERFGAGEAKNVYLSSSFRVDNSFDLIQNFGSITCADQYGYFTCGNSSLSSGRGVVYFDESPTFESRRNQGKAAIVAGPPSGEKDSLVRFEFGPLRFPRGSYFYTNFCCRPDTPHCDTQVRLYIREPGYGETLIQEIREWNDGLMGEWKFKLDDVGIFDQEFYYILEVQSNGGADAEDLITFANTRIY